jgi:hypothetical protein
VVEGSVQREADHVRVTAELIEASSDSHAWAETYDGQVADVLSIQSEIAERISNQLGAKLSQQERSELAAKPTQDMAAFESYIRARAFMETPDVEKNTTSSWKITNGQCSLEQAVARDPKFVAGALAKQHSAVCWAIGVAQSIALGRNQPQGAHDSREAGETLHAESRVIYSGYADFKRAPPPSSRRQKFANNASADARALCQWRDRRWQAAHSCLCETELNRTILRLSRPGAAFNLRWWRVDKCRGESHKRYLDVFAPRDGPRDVATAAGDIEAGNKNQKAQSQNPVRFVPPVLHDF